MSAAPLVVVAIPTFRRPDGLARLLNALAAQEGAPPFAVVVGDNDPTGGAGLRVADAARDGFPVPIHPFAIPERGLCSVRNALFERALAVPGVSHVALIDDDEWPDPHWIAALHAQQAATGADAVGGPVRAYFPAGKPAWAEEVFLFRPDLRAAGPTPIVWGTNNALLTAACLRAMPRPWFDPAFNATGGEDLDLFTRLRAAKRRFAWAPEAWVTEEFPADRATLRWVARRLWRIGSTDTAVPWRQGGARRRALLFPKTAGFLALATAALPLAVVPGRRRVDHVGRFVRALGRVAGLAGRPYREYGGD